MGPTTVNRHELPEVRDPPSVNCHELPEVRDFKDVSGILERFRAKGRMLPEDVIYHASWVDPANDKCFQLMEAQNEESLRPWIEIWSDLVEFEVLPVVTSDKFWSLP